MNEAAFRDEYIFITYDDIIRSHVPTLIRALCDYKDEFSKFIDYSKIEPYDTTKAMWLSQIRTSYNLLEYIGKDGCNYELTLMNILSKIDSVYKDSPELVMANACRILGSKAFTKKIYVYVQNRTPYIDMDILNTIGNADKVLIVNGDFVEAIKAIPDPITMYVVNSIYMADIIIETIKDSYAYIMLAEYGYNYDLEPKLKVPMLRSPDIETRAIANKFRLNMFMPIQKEYIMPEEENKN